MLLRMTSRVREKPFLSSRAACAHVTGLLAECGVHGVPWAGWDRIDAAERSLGEAQGRPRVKLATWEGLIGAAEE